MYWFIRIFQTAAIIFFFLLLHAIVGYLLPYPFQSINMLFLLLLSYLVLTHDGAVIWLACLTHWIIELYPAETFGVLFVPATLSFLLVYWLSEGVLSRQSFFGSVTLLIIAIIFFRIGYSLYLIFSPSLSGIAWGSLFTLYAWELLLSTLTFVLVYPILWYLFPQLQGNKIRI